jgi:hypothetical protein
MLLAGRGAQAAEAAGTARGGGDAGCAVSSGEAAA